MSGNFENGLEKLAESSLISIINKLDGLIKARGNKRKAFEAKIYQKWRKPIDLLEGLIEFCFYVGEKKRKELIRRSVFNIKRDALVKLHARSLLISNEIVALVRAGYADGAHARWRSLFELEVIAAFLSEQEERVSERYLKHEIMRGYKQLKNYQEYSARLGYEPFNEAALKQMQQDYEFMIEKYGKDFRYKSGWEWIPSKIVSDRTLRGLAKHLKVDHFMPYYDLSSNKIHGGPKGFYHMGLPSHLRDRTLLIGPSIFGMTDSLHSTAISLQRATVSLIKQEANASNILEMKVIMKIVDEIGQSSLTAHRDLEQGNRGNK
jgi:Family of unknown function (DUF5677)